MPKIQNIYHCDMCGGKYQMGPGKYDGKYIPNYLLNVCMGCYDGNWDGWAPLHEQKLLEHFKRKGLSLPIKNKKGWFPRE